MLRNNGRPADTLIPYGLEPIFGKREACYDVTGVGSSVEQYLERACNEVGGAMTFGISRKLRSTRALDSGKAVIPLPFESQGGLHENWRITFKQWATHWASCGEGRDCQEQGQIARIWLVKAATVVQNFRLLNTTSHAASLTFYAALILTPGQPCGPTNQFIWWTCTTSEFRLHSSDMGLNTLF